MRYVSTRGGSADRRFSEVLMEGLAPDGGLYMPTVYPKVDEATLRRWRALSYAELASSKRSPMSTHTAACPGVPYTAICSATTSCFSLQTRRRLASHARTNYRALSIFASPVLTL